MILFTITSCSKVANDEKINDKTGEEAEISLRNPTSCFDESTIPDELLCGGGVPVQGTQIFTLDSYPGCTFEVSYSFLDCQDPYTGIKYYYVQSISLESHDCQAFNDDIVLASQNGTLEAFTSEFDGELTQAVLVFIGTDIGWAGSAVLSYQTASCANYCYTPLIGKDGTNFSPLVFRKRNCGTACCLITADFYYSESCECIDYYFVNDTDPNVACELTPVPGCPSNSMYVTDCVFTCDDLIN